MSALKFSEAENHWCEELYTQVSSGEWTHLLTESKEHPVEETYDLINFYWGDKPIIEKSRETLLFVLEGGGKLQLKNL